MALFPRATTFRGFHLTGERHLLLSYCLCWPWVTKQCSLAGHQHVLLHWLIQPIICSFIGNPGLCGNWLNLPCHGSQPTERGKLNLLAGIFCCPSCLCIAMLLIYGLDHAVTLSKAAILGITLGALVILLMILLAACRPHNPSPFPDGALDKPGTYLGCNLII